MLIFILDIQYEIFNITIYIYFFGFIYSFIFYFKPRPILNEISLKHQKSDFDQNLSRNLNVLNNRDTRIQGKVLLMMENTGMGYFNFLLG